MCCCGGEKKPQKNAHHICPQFEHASQGLWHGFHSPAHDALLFLRYTCRHRALNPLLVAICVRCALEQRCWRISRNAILQGGKMGATWGQREGNVRTVRRFTFLEAESEHFALSWGWGRSQRDRRNCGWRRFQWSDLWGRLRWRDK